MASTYSKKYQGFVADVADIDFKRCDGMVYHCDSATATGITPSAKSITVNCGQSSYPAGVIETDKGLEASFTNGQWDGDMFESAYATKAEDKATTTRETASYEVATGSKIEIPYEAVEGSIYIRGMEKAESATTGKYTVTSSSGKTTITFAEGDVAVGDYIQVSYERTATMHTMDMQTVGTMARGELWYHIPVYSAGIDCTEAAIKGYIHVHIFRVRVTTPPGFDGSYKTASTYQVTFQAMDPKRPDKLMWQISYEDLTATA